MTRVCGLCARRVRHVASHVLRDHAEHLADAPKIADALYRERLARLAGTVR